MRFFTIIISLLFVVQLSAQFSIYPSSIKKAKPYYTWVGKPYAKSNSFGILHSVRNDSFFMLSVKEFEKAEDGYIHFPNDIDRRLLQGYEIDVVELKGMKKGRRYNFMIFGALIGGSIAAYDIVRSYSRCDRDALCNLFGRPPRDLKDTQVLGIGLAAGAAVGWLVGNIKFTIPLEKEKRIDKFTLFRED